MLIKLHNRVFYKYIDNNVFYFILPKLGILFRYWSATLTAGVAICDFILLYFGRNFLGKLKKEWTISLTSFEAKSNKRKKKD